MCAEIFFHFTTNSNLINIKFYYLILYIEENNMIVREKAKKALLKNLLDFRYQLNIYLKNH